MTLSSRHRIRNLSLGGLRPSTLPPGHGGCQQYFNTWMGKKHFFFQTAVTGDQTPNSSVKGSGANNYFRAHAQREHVVDVLRVSEITIWPHFNLGICYNTWRQNISLVAWLTQSPGVPGSNPAAADILFPWSTHMQWPKLFKSMG